MPLHPQAEQFLQSIAEQDSPAWNAFTPDEARAVFSNWEEMFGQGPELAHVEDRVIGDRIGIRAYYPDTERTAPAVMFFHGGGWVLGDIESHDTLCRHLAMTSHCVVISVHYRRAPEARYPAALDDCSFATNYVAQNATELRIDADRIIVAGDSAGGNLAATVCLKTRLEGGPNICGQVLLYPITGFALDTQSYIDYAEGFGLTKASMEWFWAHYLGSQSPDALAAPLLAESLSGLPPAHVVLAEYDVLRTEGEQYAQRLLDAGVPTTSKQYDGQLHGFMHFASLFDAGKQAIADVAEVIQRFADNVE